MQQFTANIPDHPVPSFAMTAPSSCYALITSGGKLNKASIPLPRPEQHQVLVRVLYVAQNPTDGRSAGFRSTVFAQELIAAFNSSVTRQQRLW